MGTLEEKPNSLHHIKEFELKEIDLNEEYDVVQTVGEGWFAKVLLVEQRATRSERVLKAQHSGCCSLKDFYREFHYSYQLGHHKNIVRTFHVAFESQRCFFFAQEFAPFGDLTNNLSETGIGEINTKRVAKQIAHAVEFMHSKGLVHRDVKMDNILIFKSDFSKVKLCDMSEARPKGTVVTKFNEWVPYSPPEVVETAYEKSYVVDPSHDLWQMGILLYLCLTGRLPWQKADQSDPNFAAWAHWLRSRTLKTPKFLKPLSSKGRRLFRKMLEPRMEKRFQVTDILKYMDDKWLSKNAAKGLGIEDDLTTSLSMVSFHSSATEKGKLLFTLSQFGIETTVDRGAKKDRIKEWIQASVVEEVDEEEAEEEEEEEDEEGSEGTSTNKGSSS